MAIMLQKPKVALWPLEVEQNASDYTTAAEALEQCAPSELLRIAKYANKKRSRASLITNRSLLAG
jgi:hypothetical protein